MLQLEPDLRNQAKPKELLWAEIPNPSLKLDILEQEPHNEGQREEETGIKTQSLVPKLLIK
jgi:hypothetical protein